MYQLYYKLAKPLLTRLHEIYHLLNLNLQKRTSLPYNKRFFSLRLRKDNFH